MEVINNKKLILVPCDFSPLAYHALEHGANMAKAMKSRLVVLHVAHKEAEIATMEKKLHFVADDCSEKFGVLPEIIVRHFHGEPYSVIKEVANELNPIGVILKTGGGTKTVELLAGTSIPFLVIQDSPKSENLKDIAFPINFMQKLDEKMKRVVHFADYYPDATMHIISPSGKHTEKERNVTTAVNLTGKVLSDQNIKTNYILHDKKKNSAETILHLCDEMDMIVVQMEETTWLKNFLFGLREEKLVTNDRKIPVLCFRKESDFK